VVVRIHPGRPAQDLAAGQAISQDVRGFGNSAGVHKLLPQQIEGFKVKVENLKGPITVLPAGP
jgi:hypothetical protein